MDAIFIMSTISEQFLKKNIIYSINFIDFAKAFHSVNHILLWQKIYQIGDCTKMLSILQSIYKQASSVVLMNNVISFQFSYMIGV